MGGISGMVWRLCQSARRMLGCGAPKRTPRASHPPLQVKVLGSCGTTNTSPGLDDEFPDDEGQNARSHPLYESLQASAQPAASRSPRLKATRPRQGCCPPP